MLRSSPALSGFLRSAALLGAALSLFFGLIFLQSRTAAVSAPRDALLDQLISEKRDLQKTQSGLLLESQRENFAASFGSRSSSSQSRTSRLGFGLKKSEQHHAGGDPQGFRDPSQPADSDVLKAIALIDNGQISDAVAALEAIIKKDPRNDQALVELAMLQLLDMKDPEQAIHYLQKAISVAPSNQVVLSELVSLYDEERRLDEGITFLQDLERQNPTNPDLSYALGEMLSLSGRDSEAITYLEKAATQGDPLRSYRELAEAYSRTGDSEHAIEAYDKAVVAMEKDLEAKKAQGIPATYIEETMQYTKLDKVRELIRMNDFDTAQKVLDEVRQRLPGDEGVASLQQNLNQKRAG